MPFLLHYLTTNTFKTNNIQTCDKCDLLFIHIVLCDMLTAQAFTANFVA